MQVLSMLKLLLPFLFESVFFSSVIQKQKISLISVMEFANLSQAVRVIMINVNA